MKEYYTNPLSYPVLRELRSRNIMLSSSGMTRLYISNLSFSTTEAELFEYFKNYGVKSVLIPSQTIRGFRTNQVRPLGIGYAEFETPKAVQEAINALNGKDFRGRELRLKPYVPYSPEHVTRKMSRSRTLSKIRHMKRHSTIAKPNTQKEDEVFRGSIPEREQQEQEQSSAIQDQQTREDANIDVPVTPIELLNDAEVVPVVNEEEPELSDDTVYVGYLPKGCTDVELRDHFRDFKPQEIWIFRTRPTRSKHLRLRRHFIAALVRLKTPEKMATIVETSQKKKLMGKKVVIRPAIIKKIHDIKKMAEEKKKVEERNYIVIEEEELGETPGEEDEEDSIEDNEQIATTVAEAGLVQKEKPIERP